MTSHSKNSKEKLGKIVDFLIEDIDSMSPEEVRAELDEMGIRATDAQSMVNHASEQCKRQLGASKLAHAKQTLRELSNNRGKVVSISGAQAKVALQTYWKQHPDETPTTLAARKGSDISEDTALKMYQSLVELGAIPPKGNADDV